MKPDMTDYAVLVVSNTNVNDLLSSASFSLEFRDDFQKKFTMEVKYCKLLCNAHIVAPSFSFELRPTDFYLGIFFINKANPFAIHVFSICIY